MEDKKEKHIKMAGWKGLKEQLGQNNKFTITAYSLDEVRKILSDHIINKKPLQENSKGDTIFYIEIF